MNKPYANQDIILELKSSKEILISELERYESYQSKKNKKMRNCCNCKSSDALGIKESNGIYTYHCFSCNTGGDVINLIQEKEDVSFPEALKILCDRNSIEYKYKTKKKANSSKLNKNNVINYFEKQSKKELEKGNFEKAYIENMKAVDLKEEKNNFEFPYVDLKNNPLRIWENIQALLEEKEITVTYNIIEKEINILNTDSDDFNSQVLDIHSLCNKEGLRVTIDFLVKAINRIGMKNKYNPVIDYLEECEAFWDGNTGRIKEVADCLISNNFDNNLKYILLKKWLLNTVNIAYNEGYSNTEGCLVLQGPQGCGKTSFIKNIIPPQFLKTGLDLNPSETDSIRKCIKYWVVELGELDATMKSDQAKLKAFLTESVDEYRLPYAISPMRYNRTTSFFGTVNKSNFLKDETGDRRYWVIPVEEINLEKLKEIDIKQFWGEIMSLLPYNLNNLNLNKEELKKLAESNEEFRVKGNVQIQVETGFLWSQKENNWKFIPTSEIAAKLGLTTTSGLKEALEKCGAKYKRTKKARGYIVPTFIRDKE